MVVNSKMWNLSCVILKLIQAIQQNSLGMDLPLCMYVHQYRFKRVNWHWKGKVILLLLFGFVFIPSWFKNYMLFYDHCGWNGWFWLLEVYTHCILYYEKWNQSQLWPFGRWETMRQESVVVWNPVRQMYITSEACVHHICEMGHNPVALDGKTRLIRFILCEM